jgi:hypothetical protein
MAELVDNYFLYVNMYLPLLHRPTYERLLTEGLHHRDRMFGATLLLVCALGSRHSDDPRVFLEEANVTQSAGWKWYRQVQLLQNKCFLVVSSLYELQAYCVSTNLSFPLS